MRIIFWNIRAGGGKRADGIFEQLLQWKPDVIGLGEFRGTPASQQLAANLAEAEWPHQIQSINPKKLAMNSLLMASRWPLENIVYRFRPKVPNRWILANVDAPSPFSMGLTHVLNYTDKRKRPMLEAIVKTARLWKGGPALFGGDTNCGKRGIDEETMSPVFFQPEHDFMENMEAQDWQDAFRVKHGDAREYTWYSHRNNGFRLDHAFVNRSMQPGLKAAQHLWGVNKNEPDRREGLSDHAALILDFDLEKIRQTSSS